MTSCDKTLKPSRGCKKNLFTPLLFPWLIIKMFANNLGLQCKSLSTVTDIMQLEQLQQTDYSIQNSH